MRITTLFLPLSISALSVGFVACSSNATVVDPGPVDSGTTDTGIEDSGPTATYGVGGTITGIAGAGLILDNGGDTVTIAKIDKTFTFGKKLAKGAAYSVKIKAQPDGPTQTCTVTAGDGTLASADVTSVAIACTTNQYAVGGTITGLTGTGAILQNNGGDDIALAANASKFVFPTKVDSSAYATVTVKTQPGTPTQTCALTNAGPIKVAGADVANVALACTINTYKVAVNVTGLTGTVVFRDNGGDDLTVNANGATNFVTAVASGKPYVVTLKTQSTTADELCSIVAPASGTITNSDVAITVVCVQHKKVFVSSALYDGNMGGLVGADAKCQGLADAAGVGGVYKAWLSDSAGNTPSARFTKGAQPYVLVDGTQVAANFAALANTLNATINKTEKNTAPPVGTAETAANMSGAVYTNSNQNGGAWSTYSCAGWTSNAADIATVFGNSTQTQVPGWTMHWGSMCNYTAPIYCFQQ